MAQAKSRAWLPLALALAACDPAGKLPTVGQAELHRSAEQRLIVVNDLGQPAALEGRTAATPALPLVAGGSRTLTFNVITLRDTTSPDGTVSYAREMPVEQHLLTAGLDVELRLRLGTQPQQTVGISTQGCFPGWHVVPAPSKQHTVSLTTATQIAGVPVRICP